MHGMHTAIRAKTANLKERSRVRGHILYLSIINTAKFKFVPHMRTTVETLLPIFPHKLNLIECCYYLIFVKKECCDHVIAFSYNLQKNLKGTHQCA